MGFSSGTSLNSFEFTRSQLARPLLTSAAVIYGKGVVLMKKINLIFLTAILALFGMGLITTTTAQAGGFGFAYGTGFQNIPANRYVYVTQFGNYPQVVSAVSAPEPTPKETTMAPAVTEIRSLAKADSGSTRAHFPKKELLPLTGPRLN